ncbi:hypothetical protein B0H13DRAFT_2305628 [Mycena leptocephala]|nr:hypothetical protein B0H13DRAFT_2305628 [Mycena leptocephala]
MFHFTLKHVPGKTFGPDGLSRRYIQPGDPEFPHPEEDFDNNEPPEFHSESAEWPPLREFEDFKKDIDTRGGYLNTLTGAEAQGPENFVREILFAEVWIEDAAARASQNVVAVFSQTEAKKKVKLGPRPDGEPLIPSLELKYDPEKREPYPEDHRSDAGKLADDRLLLLRDWWKNPSVRPTGMDDQTFKSFMRFASAFFADGKERLYHKATEGSAHQLVVGKEHRMYMMRAAHDCLCHRGVPDSSLEAHRHCHSAPWIPTRKSLEAARQRKKAPHTSSTQPQPPSESTLLCSPTSDAPALEFPSSSTPIEPHSDDEEFLDYIAVPIAVSVPSKR